MKNFKETSKKKALSAKSLNDLMTLLLKLNAKLREKISSLDQKKNGVKQMDVVIIFMSNQEEKPKPVKNIRVAKAKPLKEDWIRNLCEEIENGPRNPKKS